MKGSLKYCLNSFPEITTSNEEVDDPNPKQTTGGLRYCLNSFPEVTTITKTETCQRAELEDDDMQEAMYRSTKRNSVYTPEWELKFSNENLFL